MISILFPNNSRARTPKLHVAAGSLQPYIDPKQPPTKRAPWRQVQEVPFIKSVTINLPSTFYDAIWHKLEAPATQRNYAKVFMKLEDILTGDFFNNYVKIGNILMIAEGEPGVDNLFTLCQGTLRLDLGKEDYQRAGLQGSPSMNHGARKHAQDRFIIEYDLRSPSMVKGKKGFDRLLYAAKNVLNYSKVWLFQDMMPAVQQSDADAPIMKHHPTIVKGGPQVDQLEHVAVPEMVSQSHSMVHAPAVEDQDNYYEIAEWLSLVNMKSPRVQRYDHPDPYICRYMPPGMSQGEPPPTRPVSLKILQWTGLMNPEWINRLLIEIIKHSRATKSDGWVGVAVNAHATQALGQIDGYTILLQPSSGVQNDTGNILARPQLLLAFNVTFLFNSLTHEVLSHHFFPSMSLVPGLDRYASLVIQNGEDGVKDAH